MKHSKSALFAHILCERVTAQDIIDRSPWIMHDLTGTWFEAFEVVDDKAVGFDFWDEPYVAPISECHHTCTFEKSNG